MMEKKLTSSFLKTKCEKQLQIYEDLIEQIF
jgi:hypothetical protein